MGRGPRCTVMIVSSNPETVAELQAYLDRAGIRTHGASSLSSEPPPATTAVVLFPDELGEDAACDAIRRLRASRPRARVVVVTGRPGRFLEALAGEPGHARVVVLPKPAFGWAILDAIRGASEGER